MFPREKEKKRERERERKIVIYIYGLYPRSALTYKSSKKITKFLISATKINSKLM